MAKKLSALELAEIERLLSEADRLVAQWWSAAPCPQHGQASLALGLRSDGKFFPLDDPADDAYRDALPNPRAAFIPISFQPRVFAVACCVCDRITGTFVNARGRLQPYRPGQSKRLAEIRAQME
ncbi:MAG: hypothetical protein FWF02_11370 [Micrococcales bacterium]|nr:hypothetical protein [Micrococcales bacterium]MCL2668286.1 hypothetical protein [Micrococcales bacterium]